MRPSRVGALVVMSALGVAAVSTLGRPAPSIEIAAPMSMADTPAPVPSRVARSVPHVSTTATVPTADQVVLGPVEVARHGLEAWGRFAVSTDTSEVAPWFSASGPQWERFVAESAGGGVGGRPYSVSLSQPGVSEGDDEVMVSGRVVFVRTGEPSQTFWWRIVLVREAEEWRIWTVEEAD